MLKKLISVSVILAVCTQVQSAPRLQDFDDDLDELEYGIEDFYGGDDFVSIATGSRQLISKAPSVASVITAQDIRRMGARNVVEALALVPGLNISRSSQVMAPKFNFRGITSTFSPQSLVMVNGVPLTSVVRGDNHIIWAEYPVNSIARIEVIRGPGSALYGADAFSGVINIITKSAAELSDATMGIEAGTFDTVSGWFNFGTSEQELKFGLNVEYRKTDGHDGVIVQDAQFALDQLAEQLFGLPPVSLAPGSVNVGFEALDINATASINNFTLNLLVHERSNLGNGQGVIEALDPNGKFGGSRFIFDASYENEGFSENWGLKANLNYYRSSQSIEEDMILFPPGTFFGAFPDGLIGNPEWDEDTAGANVVLDYAGLKNHIFTFGGGLIRQDLFDVRESKNFLPDTSPNPNGVVSVTDNPAEVFLPESSRNIRYAFVQDVWQVAPDWELTAGIRYDHYSDFGSTVNPRIALVWSSSLKSSTKFIYGRAFRAPAFAELFAVNNPLSLGNPDLSPETIDTAELAYFYKMDDALSWRANIFYYQIDDFINFLPNSGTTTFRAQNFGERTGIGVELEGTYKVSESLILKGSYSYVKAEDDIANDDVGDYPNHQFKALIDWQLTEQWSLSSIWAFVGTRERTPFDNREPLDGFVDVSLNLSYLDTVNDWKLTLSAKNLFDDNLFEPSTGPSTPGGPVNIPNDLPQADTSFFIKLEKFWE